MGRPAKTSAPANSGAVLATTRISCKPVQLRIASRPIVFKLAGSTTLDRRPQPAIAQLRRASVPLGMFSSPPLVGSTAITSAFSGFHTISSSMTKSASSAGVPISSSRNCEQYPIAPSPHVFKPAGRTSFCRYFRPKKALEGNTSSAVVICLPFSIR